MEMEFYRAALQSSRFQVAWHHLERAHILGQPFVVQHTQVHWEMLLFGIKIKSVREIAGQIPRLLVGGIKSFIGVIPAGNTGGANVPALKPMEIPDDLKEILNMHKTNRKAKPK